MYIIINLFLYGIGQLSAYLKRVELGKLGNKGGRKKTRLFLGTCAQRQELSSHVPYQGLGVDRFPAKKVDLI